MDTDRLFYELFRTRPEWLGELAGLPVAAGSSVTSPVLKQLELRCDLLVAPADPEQALYRI